VLLCISYAFLFLQYAIARFIKNVMGKEDKAASARWAAKANGHSAANGNGKKRE
jgi:hypothetical protein